MKCRSCGGVNEWRQAKCAFCYAPTNRKIRFLSLTIAMAGGTLGALMFLASAAA